MNTFSYELNVCGVSEPQGTQADIEETFFVLQRLHEITIHTDNSVLFRSEVGEFYISKRWREADLRDLAAKVAAIGTERRKHMNTIDPV